MSQQDILYNVLCFKGYQGVGAREVVMFQPTLEAHQIPHLMERIPLTLVKEYDLRPKKEGEDGEGDSEGYCNLGLIIQPRNMDRVKGLLKQAEKQEDQDFIFCNVTSEHKELGTLVENWDDVFASRV